MTDQKVLIRATKAIAALQTLADPKNWIGNPEIFGKGISVQAFAKSVLEEIKNGD